MNCSFENNASERMNKAVTFLQGSQVFVYTPDQRSEASKWYSATECRSFAYDGVFQAKRIKDLCSIDNLKDAMEDGYILPEDILGIEDLLSSSPKQVFKERRGYVKACVLKQNKLLAEGKTLHEDLAFKLADFVAKISADSVKKARARAAMIV